jgi:hypothetical protein
MSCYSFRYIKFGVEADRILLCWAPCYPGPIIPNNGPKKLGSFSRPQPHEVEPGPEISGFQVLLFSHGYPSVSAHVNESRFAHFTLRVTRVLGVSRGPDVALWLWGWLRLACRGGRRLHDLASGGATPSIIT